MGGIGGTCIDSGASTAFAQKILFTARRSGMISPSIHTRTRSANFHNDVCDSLTEIASNHFIGRTIYNSTAS